MSEQQTGNGESGENPESKGPAGTLLDAAAEARNRAQTLRVILEDEKGLNVDHPHVRAALKFQWAVDDLTGRISDLEEEEIQKTPETEEKE